jgi:hypothetical protein
VQDTFLRAYRNFAGYRGGDTRAWIFTIVRNCYHSWLTDQRRKSRFEIDHHGEGDSEEPISNISSDEDNPEATLLREAQPKTVRLVLDALPRLCAKYWFCANSNSSPNVIFRISQTCRLHVAFGARERHLRMPWRREADDGA